jgi:cation diffusion facilitator CzcD-associated flavoprotein CzcO
MSRTLMQLEEQAHRDLNYVDYPPHEWVIPRQHLSGAPIRDVVIVGAGMSGLSVAFLLMRARILNIVAIDRSEPGREGPWLSYARMEQLRTPKEMVGPDCGFPSLSFAAWYAATHGDTAWQQLAKAPRTVWMDYLKWFRRVAGIPVENGVELQSIDPQPDGTLALVTLRDGVPDTIYSRKVVLATGFCAAGGGIVPAVVSESLPPGRYAHSADPIDFSALEGKRVAVLGAGASAFDNAAVALESGAASVALFARRSSVEKGNVKEAKEFSTLLRYYGDLDDARRWRLMQTATNDNPPPPPNSITRCTVHANFSMHAGAHWTSISLANDQIELVSSGDRFAFDFMILGTGFEVDMIKRPELAGIAPQIALWKDRYAPPHDTANEVLGRFPYLGPNFEFVEKIRGSAPYLANIHDFGIAAVQSMGPVCVGLNGMKIGGPRLVTAISRDLFLADADAHEAALASALSK